MFSFHSKTMCVQGRLSAWRLSSDFIDDGQTMSNNATREKLGNERANICVKNAVFRMQLLRILSINLHQMFREHINGIK